jgi:hypothetical protein
MVVQCPLVTRKRLQRRTCDSSPPSSAWAIQVGLVGYAYKDIGCDSGSGDHVACFQSQVVGVGQQIGYIFPIGGMQGYLNLKAYGEIDGSDRPSG